MPIEMAVIDDLVQSTVELLSAAIPSQKFRLGGNPRAQSLELPHAPDADYRFRLWFYPDGERCITAEPLPGRHGAEGGTVAFWSWTFELADFQGSTVNLARRFDDEIRLLLHAATRVQQRRGWLFLSFALEREIATGWQHVRGCSYFRPAFNALPSDGKLRVYHAGPVAQSDERA